MLKVFLALAVLLAIPKLRAQDPDVLVIGRLDKDWSERFLEHLRAVLLRNDVPDPYERTIDGELIFELEGNTDGISPEGRRWLEAFQDFFQINLATSDFSIAVDNLGYKIENFDAAVEPRPMSSDVEWQTQHRVAGLGIVANQIALRVALMASGRPVNFSVGLVKPRLSIQQMEVPLTTVWRSQVSPESIAVELAQVDMRQTMITLQRSPEQVSISIEDIIVPNVEVRVGNRSVRLSKEKLRQFIFERMDGFKRLLLDLMVRRNLEVFRDITEGEDLAFNFPNEFYIAGEKLVLSSALKVDTLTAAGGTIRSTMTGKFCVPEDATDLQSCKAKAPVNPRAPRAGRNLQASEQVMREEISQGRANFIVSVSEPFINQALASAIKAGLLDEAFEEVEGGLVELAPGGAFARLDRPGELFEGYLHVKNRLVGWDRRLTGRSEVRFPISVGLQIKLDHKEGVPFLYVDVVDAKAPQSLLLQGLPRDGMPSTVRSVPRFRSKVIEKIQTAVRKFKGTRIVEMPLAFLEGTFLTRTQLTADGHGRAHARVRIEVRNTPPTAVARRAPLP
jgi:hypothetical protein